MGARPAIAVTPLRTASLRTAPSGAAPSGVALARGDEVRDLYALLLDHVDPRAGTAGTAAHMAEAIALACLGDNHLWQDLHLASRAELGALIAHWFPRLAAKNQRDMKWKKFLYKQLCEREQLTVCRAPSCAVCSDHASCFGPEA